MFEPAHGLVDARAHDRKPRRLRGFVQHGNNTRPKILFPRIPLHQRQRLVLKPRLIHVVILMPRGNQRNQNHGRLHDTEPQPRPLRHPKLRPSHSNRELPHLIRVGHRHTMQQLPRPHRLHSRHRTEPVAEKLHGAFHIIAETTIILADPLDGLGTVTPIVTLHRRNPSPCRRRVRKECSLSPTALHGASPCDRSSRSRPLDAP